MTEIRLTNTKTHRKEVFTPLDPANVRMYLCGPTVYDRAHLGNARPVVVFDVLYRLLRHVYGPDHVTYVRNFTDVDDKIIARAAEVGRPIGEITEETIGWYHQDMDALGALRPSILGEELPEAEPRATEYIDQMVAMIEALIEQTNDEGIAFAYEREGHVLFRVRAYREYGALSGRSVDDMIAGARVEVAPYKEDPLDFVLWKPSSDDQPGWDSPWGRGRPGWHIECSAMSEELLWKQQLEAGQLSGKALKHPHSFDIHAGGIDLQFPHHENEIAQSSCAHPGSEFAQVWMHNEMLQVEGKKMSKSLGNFFTVRDLLERGVPGEVIRFVLLGTHYSKPMDWTEKNAADERATLEAWYNLTKDAPDGGEVFPEIIGFMADDLNTAGAVNFLKRKRFEVVSKPELKADFHASVAFLGVNLKAMTWPRNFRLEAMKNPGLAGWNELFEGVNLIMIALPSDVDPVAAQEIALWIEIRFAARQKGLFALADRLKEGLVRAGVKLQEGAQDVRWEPAEDFDIARLPELPAPGDLK